jgi:OmcA/MtrC family decaheme c-type cytochrome
VKRCLAVAGAVLALALVVFISTAAAAERPVKKTVDFAATMNPRLNGSTTSLGKTGVVVKIQTAAIAKDGTITVRATITDSDGIPLDRLGVATKGPVSLSFICAYIPKGQTQYVSYTTTTANPTNPAFLSNPPQIQAANDSGGTFTQNAIGDYTYTFKTKAPATFDGTAVHSIGVSTYRNLAEFGTFDEWSEVSNDVYSFIPSTGAATDLPRTVVSTSACNQCHNPLIGHGGSRIKVELCIMCHTPQTINPDTQLTQDMKVLVHKIHMGKNLPSVKAGTPYRIWHRGAWSDFSEVAFPQDVRNCTTCHQNGSQADNWKTKPSAAVCTSCHDDVNLATGQNHVNLPQADDNQCKNCHNNQASLDFDASIPGAHLLPQNSTALPGIVTKILGVTNATPGNALTVQFSVTDKSGKAVDITKLTSFRIILGGPNTDYGTGVGGIRVSETTVAATATSQGNGVYNYTLTNKLPAAAAGSYTVSIQSTNNVTLLPGTTKQTTAIDAAKPTEYYFSVDKTNVAARRLVVDTSKCSNCHVNLGTSFANLDGAAVHGGARGYAQECVICHNPTLTDGTSQQSVNFAWQIHSIHRGENLDNPYVLGTTNYQEVKFPGDLRDCGTCHMSGTYLVENVGAQAAVASTGGFTKTTAPIAAACQGCHDDKATASHALANTTVLGESCAACHSAGMEFSVDRVHQRIF